MAARSRRPPDGPRQHRGLLSSHSLPPLFGLAAHFSLFLPLVLSESPSSLYSVARGICAVRQARTSYPFTLPPSVARQGARTGEERVLYRCWWDYEAGGETPSGGGGTGCGGTVASERCSTVETLDRAIPPSQESNRRRHRRNDTKA